MTIYVHNGDIGTVFELTIVDTDKVSIDVSTAAVKYIYFQDPTGARMRKTATFTTDGTDGKIEYVTIAGDIDEVGTWQVQGYAETSLGKFYTEKMSFQVLSTLYVAA